MIMLIFILDYFQEKLAQQNLSKNPKKKNKFVAIPGSFCLNFGKNEFSWKKGLCQFLSISIIIVALY